MPSLRLKITALGLDLPAVDHVFFVIGPDFHASETVSGPCRPADEVAWDEVLLDEAIIGPIVGEA